MLNQSIKSFSCLFITLFSFQVMAADVIKVTVKTQEKNAVGIGFKVNGKDNGSLGKSYSGKGPINKEYFFGYKKDSIFGESIPCGSIILQQDSTVSLIYQDNKCISVVG